MFKKILVAAVVVISILAIVAIQLQFATDEEEGFNEEPRLFFGNVECVQNCISVSEAGTNLVMATEAGDVIIQLEVRNGGLGDAKSVHFDADAEMMQYRTEMFGTWWSTWHDGDRAFTVKPGESLKIEIKLLWPGPMDGDIIIVDEQGVVVPDGNYISVANPFSG